jgi:sulfur carrier protein ThiS
LEKKEQKMAQINFNAFSFLKTKLKESGAVKDFSAPMEIEEGISVNELIESLGLEAKDVEAVFINHKILPKETKLKDGDRVALVPPGGVPNHVRAYVGAVG